MFRLSHLTTELDGTGTKHSVWEKKKNSLNQSLNQYQVAVLPVCRPWHQKKKKKKQPPSPRTHTLAHAYIRPTGDTLRKKHIPRSLSIGQCDWIVAAVEEEVVEEEGGLFLQEPHVFRGWLVTAEYLLTLLPSDSSLQLPHRVPVTCTFPDKVRLVFLGKLVESRQFFLFPFFFFSSPQASWAARAKLCLSALPS